MKIAFGVTLAVSMSILIFPPILTTSQDSSLRRLDSIKTLSKCEQQYRMQSHFYKASNDEKLRRLDSLVRVLDSLKKLAKKQKP